VRCTNHHSIGSRRSGTGQVAAANRYPVRVPRFIAACPIRSVRPWLGRFFVAEDAGNTAEPVVVLSYGLWAQRFGADSTLVGRAVRLNGREYVVAGIARPELEDPQLARGGRRTATCGAWKA
jgi:hypothetical protein